jgi:alkylation response protein AidB-like acyl-CoA dehydrogenase
MSPEEKTSLFGGPIWSSDAEAYREEIRDDLARLVAPLVDQAERDRQFPRAAIERLGERGHFSRRWAHPGPHGDVGMATIFANELGKLLAGGIGAGLSLQADAALAILRTSFSDSPFVQRLHEDALWGRKVLCIAVSEPSSGSDPGRFLTRASEDPDGSWTIEGRKKFISLSATADYALVLARTGDSRSSSRSSPCPRGTTATGSSGTWASRAPTRWRPASWPSRRCGCRPSRSSGGCTPDSPRSPGP